MSKFSDMLSYLRKDRKFSQQELADKVGISRSAIGMYETGVREPDFETLEALADVFNVNMDVLVGRSAQTTFHDLSEDKQKLIFLARSLPDDKCALALKVLQSIAEDD